LPPLRHVGRVSGQDVRVEVATLPIVTCVPCLVAITAARRGHTSHLMAAGITASVHEVRCCGGAAASGWGVPVGSSSIAHRLLLLLL